MYSPSEVAALMAAAGRLEPPLPAATWQALIGLPAVTSMRKSEACHLDWDPVDLDAGALVIIDAKVGKSRQLFLHPTTAAALRPISAAATAGAPYRRRPVSWCLPAATAWTCTTSLAPSHAGQRGRDGRAARAAPPTIRQAAYDPRKFRGKSMVAKPGRTRRYQVSPPTPRTIAALLTLRDQVINPILAGINSPWRGPQTRHLDPHRPRLRDPPHRHAEPLPRPRHHSRRRIDNILSSGIS